MAFDFEDVPALETERLLLRRIVASDFAAWAEIWQDARVRRYLIEFESRPTDNAVWSIFDWSEKILRRKTGVRWAITLKGEERMIGSCGFHLYELWHRRLEIGYELGAEYWRRGIMTEAVGELLRFCFDRMDVHRVEADVAAGNDASAALLRKLGFALEGVSRDKALWRGAYHDTWQFALLEADYRRRMGG